MDLDIDYLRTWIGKQDRESDTVTPELVKRFRATLSGCTELTEDVPLGIHWCLALPAASRDKIGVDGHPEKGGFIPPVPLPRRMWASSKICFHSKLSLGGNVERISTITDVVAKHSSASGPLVFVHIDHTFAQSGEVIIEDQQTVVYRQASVFKQPALDSQSGLQGAENSALTRNVSPNSTLLFRYSALTFNAHRIHYDHNYTTSEEGYPGLVVQGPLMATLLMNLVQASQASNPMREFEFRGVAPAFVDRQLQLSVGDPAANSIEARNQDGALVMTAKAQFGEDSDS
ncbi:MAG: MaoC family dehydratase N-terminal domain-containing protein [Pseudomonadales bacterium]